MTHSRLLRAAAAVALGLVVATSSAACGSSDDGAGQQTAATHLSPTDFGERASQAGAVLLDVRTPDEFAAGHLQGAINIDVEAGDFADRVAELDKGAVYAVYCRSGNRSQTAMATMSAAGFTDLADLTGGITAWADAGGAVVTD
jgi:rhodanese-related sulfurtransferase